MTQEEACAQQWRTAPADHRQSPHPATKTQSNQRQIIFLKKNCTIFPSIPFNSKRSWLCVGWVTSLIFFFLLIYYSWMFKYHLLRTCCPSLCTSPQFSFKKKGNVVIHSSVCVWDPYSSPWVSIPVLAARHYCVHYCSFLTVLISSIADNSPFDLQEWIHCTWSLKFICQFSKSH